jgi:membrane associated rhomboid family serine protease
MIIALIVINVLFSFAAFSNKEVMGRAIFNPYVIHENREWWRFVTSGFIHADFLHLFINMFVLYSFGDITLMLYEETFGELAIYYFLVMYFGGMIVSHLPAYKKHKDDPAYNSLGASGAISSLVFAFIVFQPLTPLYLYGFIKLPAIVLGVLYLAYSYYASKRSGDYINHEAHFWGAVFGFVFTLTMKPELFGEFIDSIKNAIP